MNNVIKLPLHYQGDSRDTAKVKKVVKRRSFTSVFVSRIPRYFMYAIVVYIAFSFGDQLMKINAMNREVEKVNQQLVGLEERNHQLKKEIKNLQSKTYVERIAREKLGLVKPGEVVILQAETNNQVKAPEREQNESNIH